MTERLHFKQKQGIWKKIFQFLDEGRDLRKVVVPLTKIGNSIEEILGGEMKTSDLEMESL